MNAVVDGGWPGAAGYPLESERDGAHYLRLNRRRRQIESKSVVGLWQTDEQIWYVSGDYYQPEDLVAYHDGTYHGPVVIREQGKERVRQMNAVVADFIKSASIEECHEMRRAVDDRITHLINNGSNMDRSFDDIRSEADALALGKIAFPLSDGTGGLR